MRPKIGLVLGGGGSRGLAHIGVLEVLARERIPIDLIVGTSMGGIIGALFAHGVTPSQLAERLTALRGTTLFSMNLFSARARQRNIEIQLNEALKDKTFADLRIPLTVMTVDMVNGREVPINDGPLIPALLATSAVPAVFPPVEIDGMQLLDGGVIDSLATHIAFENGAERVIAVDVYPPLEVESPWIDPVSAIMGFQLPFGLVGTSSLQSKPPSMLASIWRATRVMAWHLHEERLNHHAPHVLLRPPVNDYGSLDFRDVQGPMNAGIEETERHLDEIRALLEKPTYRMRQAQAD
ncbi:MAG: patatin-like phospholipase family protein [Chloroflexi bacterium]|nr:patatin-like phospholipase family protein [Chloroflexota bacterium]